MQINKGAVVSGFIWRLLERCGAQGVTFIVSIILARKLDPSAYGTVALISVFISILSVFIDSGLSTALIQKKDADDTDFSTMFFFNVVMCTAMYLLLFFFAPLIEIFYNMPGLTPVIRVLGLTLLISGVKSIQQSYVSRNVLFKKFFFATLGGTIGASVVGIWMAYSGFGVWAIVAQSLFNNTVDTLILWFTVKWRPKLLFSFKRLKTLFSFGWKILASSLLDTVYNKLRQLIIGKRYSSEDLAFYNKGHSLPELIINNVCSAINSVLFPTMSAEQDNIPLLKQLTRRSIQLSTYTIVPIMVGLGVCAEPLIRLLLTEKWIASVFYMRIFCFSFALYPIHIANLNAIKAMGRSDLFLKLEIIKKVIGLVALLTTMWISVEAMAYSLLVTGISSQIINSWPNKKLMQYGYLEQIKDILPSVLLSLGMGTIVYLVQWLALPDFATLCIQVPLGIILYVVGSKVFRFNEFEYILGALKNHSPRKKTT